MTHHMIPLASRRRQSGQAALLIVVMIAVFLLAFIALAIDFSSLWTHRQMAQAAADAACQAASIDLLYPPASTSPAYFVIGTAATCTASSTSTPCRYGALNGYSGSQVSYTFPTATTGMCSPVRSVTYPCIKVTVTDNVGMSFAAFATGSNTGTITASATCGIVKTIVPTPLQVLDPTGAGSLSLSGGGTVSIISGPKRSIQVDSSNSGAVSDSNNTLVDLSAAGPNGNGGDFAVHGTEAYPGSSVVNLGATGRWLSPTLQFGDPWYSYAVAKPSFAGTASPVPLGWNGCPDPSGCVEFTGGDYTSCLTGQINVGQNACLTLPLSGGANSAKFSASGGSIYADWIHTTVYAAGAWVQPKNGNGGNYVFWTSAGGTSGAAGPAWNQTWNGTTTDGSITWKNIGLVTSTPGTAIFDSGLYYVGTGGLNADSNTTLRMSTATGDGNYGATFYFSSTGTLSVGSNSGKSSSCSSTQGPATNPGCIVSYRPDGTDTVLSAGHVPNFALKCPASGSPALDSHIPATVDGNILAGPCTGNYQADTSGDGFNRGFLIFQNHDNSATASWGGGGQFIIAGFMYMHSTSFGSGLQLSGHSGATSYTLGSIVVDDLTLKGGGTIAMILGKTGTGSILSGQLLE